MNRSAAILTAAALLVALGALTQVGRMLSHRQAHAQVLRGQVAQLERETAAQRQTTESTRRQLALAEAQLAELLALAAPKENAASRERATEVQAWLGRVKKLKQLFEQRPEQRIPEMRLLTDEDWLRIGKKTPVATDEDARAALATVRTAAKNRFLSQVSAAMQKFAAAGNTAPPAGISALAPYFENPADAEFLPRYDLSNPVQYRGSNPPVWAVLEKDPVDADYDIQVEVNSAGSVISISPPTAWIPNFRERLQQAAQAYAAANHGAELTDISQAIPLMNPPLESAQAERVLKAQSKNRR